MVWTIILCYVAEYAAQLTGCVSRTAGSDDILRLAEVEALDALVDAEHRLVHVGARARRWPRRLLLWTTGALWRGRRVTDRAQLLADQSATDGAAFTPHQTRPEARQPRYVHTSSHSAANLRRSESRFIFRSKTEQKLKVDIQNTKSGPVLRD